MNVTVVDLFCGIGGLTHGLSLAGLNVAAGIDIDASCRFPYEKNNNAVFIEGDVSKINTQTIMQYYNEEDVRVLVGCAQCQPFSKYTKRYRKDGHTDDKWKLLDSFAEKVMEVMPEIVSMENVPEIVKEKVFVDFVKNP